MSNLCNEEPYKAVDGRVYEPDFSLDDPCERKDAFHFRFTPSEMSIKIIYSIEMFLEGKHLDEDYRVPAKDVARIKKEYPMLKQSSSNGAYKGDKVAVWEVLKAKYPLATAKYLNYTEALYAAQYGAEPIRWTAEVSAKKEAGMNA